jgi:hypothetical protein
MRETMRRTWLAWVLVPWLAAPVCAQTRLCSGCFLGVYDDPQMTRATGGIARFEVKTIYLGLRLSAGVGISSLSFDATYPGGFFVVDYTPYVSGTSFRENGSGILVEWPTCVRGSRMLFAVRVFTFDAVRDAVLQLRDARGKSCENPSDLLRIPAGCYVLNSTGRSGCLTAVESATWAGMKYLFK